MTRKYILSYIFLFILGGVWLSVSVGLFELPDSFFFTAIGHFILSGEQMPISPFNITIPSTLNAPLYGIFIASLLGLPSPTATIVIPFLQLCMILVSSLIVRTVAGRLYSRFWGNTAMVVFLLLPFQFVYAMTLMSEITALFLCAVFLYILFGGKKSRPFHPSALVFVSGILSVTRIVFSFLFYLCIVYWIWIELRDFLQHKHPQWVYPKISRVSGGIGILCVVAWMLFNLRYHGTFAMYNQSGRALYYGAVTMAHLFPADTDPSMIEMKKRVPSDRELILPHNQAVLYFADEFRAGKITETQIDAILLAFSKAAIRQNFLKYIRHIAGIFMQIPMTPPYHALLLNYTGQKDPLCPECRVGTCRISWSPPSCQPAVHSPFMQQVFGRFIQFERLYYPYVMLIGFALVCVGILASVRQKGVMRLVAVGYVFFHGIQSVGVLDGRYLIPLYPVYALLLVSGLRQLRRMVPLHFY